MTPDSKAIELVSRFKRYADRNAKPSSVNGLQSSLGSGGITYSFRDRIENAKQCALIVVDEILNCSNKNDGYVTCDKDYWKSVKIEIKKL